MRLRRRRRISVTVVYRSGAVVRFRCAAISVTESRSGGITRIEWDDARPRPLRLGVDDVAAVYTKRWLL